MTKPPNECPVKPPSDGQPSSKSDFGWDGYRRTAIITPRAKVGSTMTFSTGRTCTGRDKATMAFEGESLPWAQQGLQTLENPKPRLTGLPTGRNNKGQGTLHY
ncbi:unnamed protein product [Calypogeia fissa]